MDIQRVGAGIAVLAIQQILLVQRRDNGLWDIPGGGVNVGEQVETAAIQELHEETNILLPNNSLRLVHVFSGHLFRHTYPDGNVVNWVTVLYRADLESPMQVQCGDDACAAAWWPLSHLPQEMGSATKAYFLHL